MKIIDLKDSTQERILPHLNITEQLIRNVGKKLSGRNIECEITAMEDLGLSHNINRMCGGFFTGIHVHWDFDVPFIPVDSTVNSCGVSIFIANDYLPFSDFKRSINEAKQSLASENIQFNFDIGNHFICFCQDEDTGKYYLVVHASDNAYKYGMKGLYPREDTWYYDHIRVEYEGKKYLRYIEGKTAETFWGYYHESEKSNPLRNERVAKAILRGNNYCQVLYTPHYGMPDPSSIAIGCQWKGNDYVLLTSEGKDIYIIEEIKPRKVNGFPHGLGVEVNGVCLGIDCEKNCLHINSINIPANNDTYWRAFTKTRYSNVEMNDDFIIRFLRTRNIVIKKRLRQLYSYSATGFHTFEDEKNE